MLSIRESDFQMPHQLSSKQRAFDLEVLMVLNVFFLEIAQIKKIFVQRDFNRINPAHFNSFRKLRNIHKVKSWSVPVGHRSVSKSVSQKFQGLHRRAFVEFPLEAFERDCEALLLDRVSRNFYVDNEEIGNDFFFAERQVSDDGVSAQAGDKTTPFSDYFENQLMDIEKMNRLGRSTSFGFRFAREALRASPGGMVRFSHNLHLRYSESLRNRDDEEYFFDAFSPKLVVVCAGELAEKNSKSFRSNLDTNYGILPFYTKF